VLQVEFPLSAPAGFQIERLNAAVHDRDCFSCDVEDLDVWLRTQASQAHSRNLSTTYVIVEASTQPEVTRRPVIGYVTILNRELAIADAPASLRKITDQSSLPIILLARMAVDKRHHYCPANE
jgi:hypothetical protein